MDVPALLLELDHDDYHRRIQARAALIDHLVSSGDDSLIRSGIRHSSSEVQFALREIENDYREIKLDEDLAAILSDDSEDLATRFPGWKSFADLAGRDKSARVTFTRLCKRFGSEIVSPTEIAWPSARIGLPSLDITTTDFERWNLMLLYVLVNADRKDASCYQRDFADSLIKTIASHSSGPATHEPLVADANASTITYRLIGKILDRSGATPVRYRLLTSAKYNDRHRATRICDRILRRQSSTAIDVATALLVAAKYEPANFENALRELIHDHRRSSCWQLVMPEMTVVETQVSDVAHALLLTIADQDPRDFGFKFIEADPVLVYTLHSLGFASDQARKQAYSLADQFLSRD